MTSIESTVTAKGRQTRARILEHAATIMLQRGAAAATIDEICSSASVGKSQVYHYFSDKSALVRGVIEYQTEEILTGHEVVFGEVSSWEDWESWRDAVIELQELRTYQWGCPLGSLASELADADDLAREVLSRSFERWRQAFEVGLRRMIDAELLRPDVNVSALATYMVSVLQGGLLLSRTARDGSALRDSIDCALDHLRSLR